MEIAPRLETQRQALEPLTKADAPFFAELATDPEVRRFLGGPVPQAEIAQRFERYLIGHPKIGIWKATPRGQTDPAGLMVLAPHRDGAAREVSYTFATSHWGRGLAQDATSRVVRHALSDLGLPRVIAETQAANQRSIRLLERLGFELDQRIERFGAQQLIYVTTSVSARTT